MLITIPLLILLTAVIPMIIIRYKKHYKKGILRRSKETWAIGIYKGTSPLKLLPPLDINNPILTAQDVTDVKARFVADPFMIKNQEGYYLFFEVLNDKRNLGELGYAFSSDGLHWQYRKIILKEHFHLSYPYVFFWEENYYMIPECAKSGGMQLYKAKAFPEEWEHIETLIKGKGGMSALVDPSILYYNNHWYLFSYAPKSKNLHLFTAETITGKWKEHPKSPVVSGSAHYARPGGRVLLHENTIYRYAQDETPNYGTKVWAFRITELSKDNYSEERASEEPILYPGKEWWNKDGMHTIDAHQHKPGEWIAAVDGFTINPVFD